MVTKIEDLKQLPYANYTGHLLKKEEDAEKTADGKPAWLFVSLSPKAIYLFVKGVSEIEGG